MSDVVLPRSRVTIPQTVNPALWGFVAALPLLTVFAYPISKLGSGLLGFASLLVVPAILKEAIKTSWSKSGYARTPGILINDTGVAVYGDGGPKYYDWSCFGEASVSWDRKAICHDRTGGNLRNGNHDRESGYCTPVDHVAAEPDEILYAIKNHPNNPSYNQMKD